MVDTELEYVYFVHTAWFNAGRIKSRRIETSEVEHMIQVEQRWEESSWRRVKVSPIESSESVGPALFNNLSERDLIQLECLQDNKTIVDLDRLL